MALHEGPRAPRRARGELRFAGTAFLTLAGKRRDELQKQIEKILILGHQSRSAPGAGNCRQPGHCRIRRLRRRRRLLDGAALPFPGGARARRPHLYPRPHDGRLRPQSRGYRGPGEGRRPADRDRRLRHAQLWQRHTDEDTVRRHGVDPDGKSVIFVGRITRQKGLPYLLRAASRI